MKAYVDCIPCFFRQALEAAKIAGANEAQQKQVLDELAKHLPEINMHLPPPQTAKMFYNLIKEISKNPDPYLEQKKRSNELALAAYPMLQKRLAKTENKLKLAVELAIAGNLLDFGVKNSLNVDAELEKILTEENEAIQNEQPGLFDFEAFKQTLKQAKTILYLGDNAGEIVFDRILIEQILNLYPDKNIIFAVKEKPIINDALKADAIFCGLDKLTSIISSGSDVPGTVLTLCFPEFRDIFYQADLVISKGQGNFETLSETQRTIFFLFKAKCPVVAKHMNCKLGDVILFHKEL
ncbi:MAG: ARMT1-like domain-containing protein [Pseudomonadota bacterium]